MEVVVGGVGKLEKKLKPFNKAINLNFLKH